MTNLTVPTSFARENMKNGWGRLSGEGFVAIVGGGVQPKDQMGTAK